MPESSMLRLAGHILTSPLIFMRTASDDARAVTTCFLGANTDEGGRTLSQGKSI